MPDVTWTLGGSTLTFDRGILSGTAHAFDASGVVMDRLAGGAVLTYDLGLSDMETITYTFPHITQAKLDAALAWKDTTARLSLNTFTHTDNSKSPAIVKTVRLLAFSFAEEFYPSPSAPLYRIQATLQVEPT